MSVLDGFSGSHRKSDFLNNISIYHRPWDSIWNPSVWILNKSPISQHKSRLNGLQMFQKLQKGSNSSKRNRQPLIGSDISFGTLGLEFPIELWKNMWPSARRFYSLSSFSSTATHRSCTGKARGQHLVNPRASNSYGNSLSVLSASLQLR